MKKKLHIVSTFLFICTYSYASLPSEERTESALCSSFVDLAKETPGFANIENDTSLTNITNEWTIIYPEEARKTKIKRLINDSLEVLNNQKNNQQDIVRYTWTTLKDCATLKMEPIDFIKARFTSLAPNIENTKAHTCLWFDTFEKITPEEATQRFTEIQDAFNTLRNKNTDIKNRQKAIEFLQEKINFLYPHLTERGKNQFEDTLLTAIDCKDEEAIKAFLQKAEPFRLITRNFHILVADHIFLELFKIYCNNEILLKETTDKYTKLLSEDFLINQEILKQIVNGFNGLYRSALSNENKQELIGLLKTKQNL